MRRVPPPHPSAQGLEEGVWPQWGVERVKAQRPSTANLVTKTTGEVGLGAVRTLSQLQEHCRADKLAGLFPIFRTERHQGWRREERCRLDADSGKELLLGGNSWEWCRFASASCQGELAAANGVATGEATVTPATS